MSDAYKAKKYAFVSDYARFWILYHCGGLYFDTDVEMIRNISPIVAAGPFMAQENVTSPFCINPGLGLGAYPMMSLYRKILDFYAEYSFLKKDGSFNLTTVVSIVSKILFPNGSSPNRDCVEKHDEILIYPSDYFCQRTYKNEEIHLTPNTYCIHHFAATWIDYFKRTNILRFNDLLLLKIQKKHPKASFFSAEYMKMFFPDEKIIFIWQIRSDKTIVLLRRKYSTIKTKIAN